MSGSIGTNGNDVVFCREQLWLFRSTRFRCAEDLGEMVTRYEFAGKCSLIANATAERS